MSIFPRHCYQWTVRCLLMGRLTFKVQGDDHNKLLQESTYLFIHSKQYDERLTTH